MSEVRFDVYTTRQLGSRAPGASGAKKVGLSPVSGLDAADLQAAIEKLLQLVGQGGAPEAGASRLGVVLLSVDPADPQQPKAVGDNDARMSDARTPEGAAGGDLSGEYPDPSLADVAGLDPGTYERATVTVDAKGRVTGVSVGAAGAVEDASTTRKGATKLSAAPAVATDPIAVGDNDPDWIAARRRGFFPIKAAAYVHNAALAANTEVMSLDVRGLWGIPADAAGVWLVGAGYATVTGAFPMYFDSGDAAISQFSPRWYYNSSVTTSFALPVLLGKAANPGKFKFASGGSAVGVSGNPFQLYVVGYWR